MTDRTAIVRLTGDRLDELIQVFLSAFQKEATTASWLDLSSTRLRRYYGSVARIKFQLYLEAGNPIFAAVEDNGLTGFVVLKLPEIKITPGKAVRLLLPRLHHLAGLLPHFMRGMRRGMVEVTRVPDKIPRDHLTLEAIGVSPAHQGKKIGRMLLEQAHSYAEENCAAKGIYLLTGEEKNRLFYEKAGYTLVEARDTNGFTSYHMFRNGPGAGDNEAS